MRHNVFGFRYRGETVTVDLNLTPEECYEPPYPLGFHQIERQYFAAVHSGGGMIHGCAADFRLDPSGKLVFACASVSG